MVISSEDEADDGDKFYALLLLRQLVLLVLIFAFALLCAAIDIHYSNDLAGVWARLQEVFQVDQL